MDYSTIPSFSAMKNKLNYLSTRQGVLAQNVANSDTPGYQAMDVKTPDFKKTLTKSMGQLQLATTNKKHFPGSNIASGSSEFIKRESTFELNPNGNNVVIEEEMAKVAANQSEYQKILSIYRKSVEMFKTAIGKNGM